MNFRKSRDIQWMIYLFTSPETSQFRSSELVPWSRGKSVKNQPPVLSHRPQRCLSTSCNLLWKSLEHSTAWDHRCLGYPTISWWTAAMGSTQNICLSSSVCVYIYIYYIVCIMYMCQYVYVYVCMCIYIHTCICTPSTGHGALTSINHSAHDKISKANIVVLW